MTPLFSRRGKCPDDSQILPLAFLCASYAKLGQENLRPGDGEMNIMTLPSK